MNYKRHLKPENPWFLRGFRTFRNAIGLLASGDGGSRTRVQNIAQ